MSELRRVPDGARWCFGCRARLPHDYVIYASHAPSSYDPYSRMECVGIDLDGRCAELARDRVGMWLEVS